MRPDDKDDRSGIIVRIRGLPWDATKQEICDFFYGVNIVNGENGIYVVNRAANKTKSLEVYIELASYVNLKRAKEICKNTKPLGVCIELASYDDLKRPQTICNGGSNFGRGPNKENCNVVDAPALSTGGPIVENQNDLNIRLQALETSVEFLRTRITVLERAGGRCTCGAMTNVIN